MKYDISLFFRGTYLVSIIYSELKVCTVEECLPVILIDQAQYSVGKVSNFILRCIVLPVIKKS